MSFISINLGCNVIVTHRGCFVYSIPNNQRSLHEPTIRKDRELAETTGLKKKRWYPRTLFSGSSRLLAGVYFSYHSVPGTQRTRRWSVILMVSVGKYINPMDAMGND